MRRSRLLAGAGAAGIAALIAAGAGAQGRVAADPASLAAADRCVTRSNIEAIIDDSGSMASTDPTVMRRSAVWMIVADTAIDPREKTLGIVEFGSDATALLAPTKLSTVAAREAAEVSLQNLKADNGSTDYNDAFALARAENPAAGAWIFLTDGRHNQGAYGNGHVGGPPTYVVAFGEALASDVDRQRLQAIASDTGGRYYPVTDVLTLQSVIYEIESTLSCGRSLVSFGDDFDAAGQTRRHSTSVPSTTRQLSLAITWADSGNRYDVTGLKVLRGGKAVAAAKRSRLRLKRTRGSTYTLVQIRGLKRGKLKFGIKATQLQGAEKNVTTQVAQFG